MIDSKLRAIAFALPLILVGTAPALAATPDGAATPAAQAPAKPKRVCRVLENNTGSHMKGNGRTCLSAEQWAKRDAREARRGAGAGPVDKGDPALD